MLRDRCLLPGVSSLVLAVMFLAAGVSSAFAEQRLVRVIWDVGQGVVYTMTSDREQTGHDAFEVPINAAKADELGFKRYESYQVLRKGDRVRLYVVNYNPVAHVWHESSVVEQILPEPSLVAGLLNAGLLNVTGVLKSPGAGAFSAMVATTGVSDPCTALLGTLELARSAANTLHRQVETFHQQTATPKFAADLKKVAKIPVHDLMWKEFKNDEAWKLLLTNTEVLGFDFAAEYKPVGTMITNINAAVQAVNGAMLNLDHGIVNIYSVQPPPSAACLDQVKVVIERRDNLSTLVTSLAGPDAPLRQVIAKFGAAAEQWDGYKTKLTANWSRDAIEVIVKEPIVADASLRLDGEFASPDKTIIERTQRSIVLKAQPYFPALTISTGVGIHGFKFKTLAVTQDTVTAADGTVSAKARIGIVDDPKWDKFVPVWVQNIRLASGRFAGLYGTFGTTPDRNIFKNGIAGLSVVVPRWRTSFTAGLIAARGYEEEDLKPLVSKFSDTSGFAIKDASLATLPLEEPKWKQAGYFSVTFMLVSF